ncbi:MAG: cysteine hydrolase family protein [Spirochaetales bacterium]|nr:cysteine hydrolase family protein [Spirochaetales bacterium]
MKTALLIVDVQNIMFTEEGGAYEAVQVTSRIAALLEKARKESVPVIFIQHTDSEGIMAEGAPGWPICESIAPREGDRVVRKAYWDSFMETELTAVLKEKGIDRLVICGMQTEFCVDTTVRSAFARGFRDNVVVSDGHTTFDTPSLSAKQIRDHHSKIWDGRFARLVQADQICFS